MKPEGAIEVQIASDLSGVSLAQAHDTITKLLGHETGSSYSVLKVPSQLVSIAAILTAGWGTALEVDFSYRPDEWSLKRVHFSWREGTPETTTLEVWSPGA